MVLGVLKELRTFGPPVEGDGAGDALLAVDPKYFQLMKLAVAFRKVALSGNRLAFALFFRTDTQVYRYRHSNFLLQICILRSSSRNT